MLIQRGRQKIKIEREVPHFILVVGPQEARELHSILMGTNIPNCLTGDSEFMGELAKYLEDTASVVEKVLEEGKVEVNG